MENNEIVVIIPPEKEYSSMIYTHPNSCYLAEALKKAGYDDVSVGAIGRVRIGSKNYTTREKFSSDVVKNAFKQQIELIVTLI